MSSICLELPATPYAAMRARELVPRKYAHEEEGLPEWAETALPVAIDLPS